VVAGKGSYRVQEGVPLEEEMTLEEAMGIKMIVSRLTYLYSNHLMST